jgi:hypothetical protein
MLALKDLKYWSIFKGMDSIVILGFFAVNLRRIDGSKRGLRYQGIFV